MSLCKDLLDSKFNDVDAMFQYFRTIPADEELKAHFAKYMTMIVYGSFESGIKDAFYAHIDRTIQNKSKADHLKWAIKKNYRNIDYIQLLYLIGMFDGCGATIKNKYDNTETTASFNSIVANRQDIAHGGQCTITFNEIEEYYTKSKPLLLDLANILDSR